MRSRTKLALVATAGLCGATAVVSPAAPASATTQGNGCYHASLRAWWGMDGSGFDRDARGDIVNGPAVGTDPACTSSHKPMYIRADELGNPNSVVDIYFGQAFYETLPEGPNPCNAAVVDSGNFLLDLPLQRTTDGMGLNGHVVVTGDDRDAVLRGSTAVNMTCTHGGATWTTHVPIRVVILPAPAGRFPGVSIESGALATNSPNVRLRLAWTGLVDKVAVSNDGGFAPESTRILKLSDNAVNWTLTPDRDERLPKIVYVRFHEISWYGAPDAWTTPYTDDIILDTTAPTTTGTISPVPADATTTELVLNSADDRTGVRSMQISPYALNTGTTVRPYTSRVKVPVAAPKVYVRVRDGAGNWSSWRTAISPRATGVGGRLVDSTIRRGSTVTFKGSLLRKVDRRPLAAKSVRIQKLVDGNWKTVATRVTDAQGRYSYSWTARSNVALRAKFSGTHILHKSLSAKRIVDVMG